MPTICPTITAYSQEDYKKQIEKVVDFSYRLQIDLTDGQFAAVNTVKPENAWWPAGAKADIHLMYKNPIAAIKKLIRHQPNLIIIHAEAEGDFREVVNLCRHHKTRLGLALLPPTEVEAIKSALSSIDHLMIFSGNLGHQGGSSADLSLLDKVAAAKQLNPKLEIGWDGGVNDQNIAELVYGGVDVINVGGYIQAATNPEKAYETLQRIADETGET